MITVALALAGGAGAVSRFVVDGVLRSRWPRRLPWATMVINISGALLLGVLTGLVLYRGASTDLTAIAGTGFCGGYTTFSTASFETVRLVQQQRLVLAAVNGLGTVVLAVGAAAIGLVIVR